LAAGVALVATAGASTVVQAQEADPPPERAATEHGTGALTAPTMTIVAPLDAEAAHEQVANGSDGPGEPGATTAVPAAPLGATGAPVPTGSTVPAGSSGAPAETVGGSADGTAATTVAPGPSAPTSSTTSPASTVAETSTEASTTLAAPAAGGHAADQQTVVHGSQVAVAVSGSNELVSEQPTAGATAGSGADVSSGAADAIGSRDDNTITQRADVVLTGDAIARILQVALILNIGASLANSGANAISAAPVGDGVTGRITTGDAGAIGNDVAAYITQGAAVEATSAMDDTASQLAVSMFLGLAIADSGTNHVSGTGVSGQRRRDRHWPGDGDRQRLHHRDHPARGGPRRRPRPARGHATGDGAEPRLRGRQQRPERDLRRGRAAAGRIGRAGRGAGPRPVRDAAARPAAELRVRLRLGVRRIR
jgi:hypothetical protein